MQPLVITNARQEVWFCVSSMLVSLSLVAYFYHKCEGGLSGHTLVFKIACFPYLYRNVKAQR